MRALKLLSLSLLAVLFVLCLAPITAAHAAEVAPIAGPAPLSTLLSLVGLGAAGIVVRLSAKKYDEKGETRTERFNLDSDSDQYAEQLETFGEAKLDEGAAPLRLELSATEKSRDEYRDLVIGEVLRVQKLSAAEPDKFDVETEKAYLETLRPDQLKLHFDKARTAAAELKLKPSTSNEDPAAATPEGDDKAFGNVTAN